MANFNILKAAIDAVIRANGQQEITGPILNAVLKAMVDSLGAGFELAGVATPSTNPGTPDQDVYWLAYQGGTYTNFGGAVLPTGISMLKWDGSWISQTFFTVDDQLTPNSNNLAKSGAVFDAVMQGGVFDLSAYNGGATYADLSAALFALNSLPAAYKRGGMSVKFVQSSDNKYVQWRLTTPSWSIDPNDWVAENEDFRNKVMQEVNEAIEANTPIVVEGNVNNAPDEEDLTSVNQDGTDVLKFKDKAYTPLTYSGMGRVILRKNMVNDVNTLTQDMFYKGEVGSREPNTNTIFVIQYDYTLAEDITLPENCVLEFDGGSLSNGNIYGNISLFGNKEDSFRNVKMLGTISSKFYMYNYDSSFFAACTNGISVMCDLSFDKPIQVQTELEGNGHTIQASENAAAVIMITADDVTIKNCKLVKLLPSEDTYQKRYAIYSNKYSNISVMNCNITGALFFNSEYEDVSEAKVCENIMIVNNKVYCNFSSIGEGGYYERDVISFLGVKNAVFENNVVEAVNVNRIFKISASNLKGIYNITPEYPSDQIIIRNNRITATSRYGKQIFDLFCGGSNVTIEGNEFNISGHGQFLQDKTSVQLKNIKNVLISNNNITIENATLLDIVNNNQTGRFYFTGNNVLFKGSNINYQIDSKGDEPTAVTVSAPIVINRAKTVGIEENTFRVAENSGYIGLNLIICYAAKELYVKNNKITDLGRIATSNATLSKFVYSNNLKDAVYSTDATSNLLEVDFQSQSVINVCEIQILPKDFGSIRPIHVVGGTIAYLKLNSKQGIITDRLIKLINFSGNPTISTIESIFPIYKQSSDYVTPLHTVGISTDRPRFSQGIGIGQLYYDITLNKPIWWTGTAWIYATGASV